MTIVNENFLKLKAGYLFPEISRRVTKFAELNPNSKIIRLGIGDVTRPLTPAIIKAMHEAVDEMSNKKTFKGYGPEQGYAFLRDKIAENDYKAIGADISSEEIFISDGSKCDTGNIQEIFSVNSKIAVTDPVYPVYVDTNVMAGRTGQANEVGQYEGLVYLPTIAENNFTPKLPNEHVDIIYLCSPNNPTGTVLTKETLKVWVNFALKNKSIILFDAAYEAFITDKSLPRSIFQIEGAKECAIEFRSFSKNAGFTGTRCAFTVVPKDLYANSSKGDKVSLHSIWNRRHCTKFNGVSYPVQKAAAAVYSEEGKKETCELVSYYLKNAFYIKDKFKNAGYDVYGGENAPYIWVKTPNNMKSWDFFDKLLKEANVVGTPGAGFGACGEYYFRLSAFNDFENVKEAMERIEALKI